MAKKKRKSAKKRRSRGGARAPSSVAEALGRFFGQAYKPKAKSIARTATAESIAKFLFKNGILGIGFGMKETAGAMTPVIGPRIYVRAKQSKRRLPPEARIPDQLETVDHDPVQTDVVAVGQFTPLAKKKRKPAGKKTSKSRKKTARSRSVSPFWSPLPPLWIGRGSATLSPLFGSNLPPLFGSNLPPLESSEWLSKDLAMLRSPQRPISVGCSVGPEIEPGDMAGSLAGVVIGEDGENYLLSNNHVLAYSRLKGTSPPVPDGASIFQPGELDRSDQYILDLLVNGDQEQTPVATLGPVHPITPSNPTTPGTPTPNTVDGALARVDDEDVLPAGNPVFSLPGVSLQNPPAVYNPQNLLLRTVGKVGRTTGATLGVVVDIDARFWIPYGDEDDFDSYAWFVNQIGIVPIGGYPTFSDAGDSGSAIFDALTHELVGLLFAGGDGLTLANPIDAVFAALDIDSVA